MNLNLFSAPEEIHKTVKDPFVQTCNLPAGATNLFYPMLLANAEVSICRTPKVCADLRWQVWNRRFPEFEVVRDLHGNFWELVAPPKSTT